ncbi:MAG: LysM peptidoglycan-binding domain-containing protein [Candidatus Aminicenantes bacterium]|nr:LysM peptidoglycan-binding domain-containing protein [Candidatus Aminicenantes bacterium]
MKKKTNTHLLYISALITLSIFLLGSCATLDKPAQEPPGETVLQPNQLELKAEIEEEAPAKEFIVTPEVSPTTVQKNKMEEIDPSEKLSEAENNYNDAQYAWERGNLDTALEALDEAYRLILEIQLPPDSPLNQVKYDLRLLIAQRIQEIHASLRTAIHNNHKSIPLEENKHVLAEITSFQNRERKDFEASYKRSGLYREAILEELEKEGLPEQLSWMPMIESWFKVNAYSSARALGLWQFISSTGLRFGLKRDEWIDERMDPIKASQAAAKYLNELHSLFGDWTTALAGYNCGEFRVQRVIRAQRINYLDNFWDLYEMLPRETARFVPRFVATLLIINDPEKYGFTLPQPDPPMNFETVSISRAVSLSSLAKSLGLKEEDLTSLNPELRYKSTPENEYFLRVPEGYGTKTLSSISSVAKYVPPEATYVNHYVTRGETVSGIANKYGTSISAIARMNNLRGNYLIRQGQRLKVPGRSASATASTSRTLIQDGEKQVYVVKRNDNLWSIANYFGTTVNKLKKDNNLTSDMLSEGQKLTLQSAIPGNSIQYTVKSGDIPANIAREHGMNLDVFLRMNGLSMRSTIYPGQKLLVTPKTNR